MREISDDVIDKAIEECTEQFKWPPEISEFKKLCVSLEGPKHIPWFDDAMKAAKLPSAKVKVFIDEGSEICKRLKSLYPEQSWMKIGYTFGKLKAKAKVFHSELDDINLIREISKYTDEDIMDLLNTEMVK